MSGMVSSFLWFDREAEQAAELYVSLIPNSSIHSVKRWAEGGPLPAGLAMTVEFTLDGAPFVALNAGPTFPPTEAFSFFVRVSDQEELDRLWDALIADGGEESMCGWLKDRWGVSWQIVPDNLEELISGPDSAKAYAASQAMLSMRRLDIAALRAAYDSA